MTNIGIYPQPNNETWGNDPHIYVWRWVALGWCPPSTTHKTKLPQLTMTNGEARDCLLQNGWTPDLSRVACTKNKECTYEAFVSLLSDADSLTRVYVPSWLPAKMQPLYLRLFVGKNTFVLPK